MQDARCLIYPILCLCQGMSMLGILEFLEHMDNTWESEEGAEGPALLAMGLGPLSDYIIKTWPLDTTTLHEDPHVGASVTPSDAENKSRFSCDRRPSSVLVGRSAS